MRGTASLFVAQVATLKRERQHQHGGGEHENEMKVNKR